MALRVGGTWAYGVASIAYHSIVTLQACSRGPCIAKSILRVHSTGQTLVDGTLGLWVSFSFLHCSDPPPCSQTMEKQGGGGYFQGGGGGLQGIGLIGAIL